MDSIAIDLGLRQKEWAAVGGLTRVSYAEPSTASSRRSLGLANRASRRPTS